MAVSGSVADVAVELRGFVVRYIAAWNGCDTDAMAPGSRAERGMVALQRLQARLSR
jgi:hypothetical protein